MATCSDCGLDKQLRYKGLCSPCYRKRWMAAQPRETHERYAASGRVAQRRRYAKRRQLVRDAKSVPCMDCGVSYPWYVMDLDHRDRAAKAGMVSRLINTGMSLARLRAEIAKCDVRCANCHRIKTYESGDWKPLEEQISHG